MSQQPKFPRLEWHEAAESVSQCTFAIETHNSIGTGFVISVVQPKDEHHEQTHGIILGTAWHVISDVYENKRNKSELKLVRWSDKVDLVPMCGDIAILPILDERYDCGVVICTSQEKLFEIKNLVPFLPNDVMLKRGAQIGWLGFPGIADGQELCFFNGFISGYVADTPAYLVDGVAINGVSGGPVFDDRKHVVGFVSASIPNQLNPHLILPGMSSIVPISIILSYLEAHLGLRHI